MDIAIFNSAKVLAEAYVRERNFSNLKFDPKDATPVPAKAIKNLSPEEAAELDSRRAEDDARLAEARGQVIKRTGIDPLAEPFKYERKPPMTKEEGEAYVQDVLDRMVEGDAKYQELLKFTEQWESVKLPVWPQGSQIDTSA